MVKSPGSRLNPEPRVDGIWRTFIDVPDKNSFDIVDRAASQILLCTESGIFTGFKNIFPDIPFSTNSSELKRSGFDKNRLDLLPP